MTPHIHLICSHTIIPFLLLMAAIVLGKIDFKALVHKCDDNHKHE